MLKSQTWSPLSQRLKSFPSLNLILRELKTQPRRHSISRIGRKFSRVRSNINNPSNYEILRGPFLFTVTFSSACIIGSTIWEYETFKKKVLHFKGWMQQSHGWWNWRQQPENALLWWQQLSEGQKLFSYIAVINTAVYLLFKINNEKFLSFLMKYFILKVSSFPHQTYLPLLLSAFCHISLLHLGVNMYCLSTLMDDAVMQMGKEQFMAAYLSTAVLSGFGSYAYRVLARQTNGSVGASGAVLAMLTMHCMRNSDARLQIIFLPQISFTAEKGIKCLALFELCALIFFRNKFLLIDHAGHLAGIVSGYCLSYYGPRQKKYIIEIWEDIKEKCDLSLLRD